MANKRAGYCLSKGYTSGEVPSASGCMTLFHGKEKGRIRIVVNRVLLRYMEGVKGILLWIECPCSICALKVKLKYGESTGKT